MTVSPNALLPRPDSSEFIEKLSQDEIDGLLQHMLSGVAYCRMIFHDDQPYDVLCLYTNPAFHRLTGLDGVVDKYISEIFPDIRTSHASLLETYGRVSQGGKPEVFELFSETLGQWFSVAAYSPKAGHFISLFDVITKRKNAEAALHERATQLQFVLEGAELGFWDWNIATGEVDRNEQWALMLGYTYEEIRHTTQQWSDFVHPEDRARAWASILNAIEGYSSAHKLEYRMLHKDGSIRWILDQAKVMQRDELGRATRMCGTHTDVTERKLMEQELVRQAHIDYLTGMYNRRHFMERAEQELHRAARYDNQLSMLMLDLDHFKKINDEYGHKVGDTVLVAVARLCQETLRYEDILGRLGGEEFAVLLPQTGLYAALDVAERMRKVIAEALPSPESGMPVPVSVSIGVSTMRSSDDTIDALLNRADRVLYQAKNSGRNQVRFATNE